MSAQRFPFSIARHHGDAYVSMDAGHGVIRTRIMSPDILDLLVTACRRIRGEVIGGFAGRHDGAPPPRFPDCLLIGGDSLDGVCDLTVVASTRRDGTVEFCTAVYDAGDDTAPVLVLIGEQLDAFIDQAQHVLSLDCD